MIGEHLVTHLLGADQSGEGTNALNVIAIVISVVALLASVWAVRYNNSHTWRRLVYEQRHRCYSNILAWGEQLSPMDGAIKYQAEWKPIEPLDPEAVAALEFVSTETIRSLIADLKIFVEEWNGNSAHPGGFRSDDERFQSLNMLRGASRKMEQVKGAILEHYADTPRPLTRRRWTWPQERAREQAQDTRR